MSPTFKWLRAGVVALFGIFVAGLVGTLGIYLYLAPQLPTLEDLRDVRLQVPLRVYSRDGGLIAEFGEMKRTPLRYAEVPPQVIQAVLAAEDDRFFQHPGVDYQGLLRAAVHLLRTGEKAQGGSTITMQVARNFFLSSEKTYARKLKEIFVALTMEQELSKEEILELYLNKIYLGNRAYGIASAAQIYYGKKVEELELAQIAMIAGLPKAPSLYNPIVNPTRAIQRRNYVLGRMQNLGFIDAQAAAQARLTPVTAALHTQSAEVDAPHLAEMVRAEVVARFGEEIAYTSGYKVYTTVDSRHQQAAARGVRAGLLDYDRRHGYRGPGAHVELEPDSPLGEILSRYPVVGGLVPGIVVELEEKAAHVAIGAEERVVVDWRGLDWARRYINDERVGDPPATASEILAVGDVIRLEPLPAGGWRLAQVPQVEGALVSLQPHDGALLALVGGFDFFDSKFNRVTQAQRQPGSAFKPFVYSAALEKGFTAATVINDAPVVFEDAELESAWRPENYSGKFYGPTRLREALVTSRNLVSIRLLRAIGIGYARNYLKNFGFDAARLPHDLSLALGSGAITPMELVRGYAVLANGGYLIEPYFIQRIEDADGNVLFEAAPSLACPQCEQAPPEEQGGVAPAGAEAEEESATETELAAPLATRTLDARNVYLMNSMLNDVVARGTAARARALGRHDLAGKTGTTNDQRDAWFCGYNADVAATAWLGFDTPRSLGGGETGAGAALPIWVDYMREALAGLPEHPLPQPAGVVTVRIDPETGLSAAPGNANAVFETFYSENVPSPAETGPAPTNTTNPSSVTEQLF
jgi:penicillin-binding protein 1A